MKKKLNFITIICIFILLQPIFDVCVYFLREYMNIDSLVISAIRPLFAGLTYLYLLISNKVEKKDKIMSLIFLIIYSIYSIFHLLNVRNYFFGNSAGTISSEIRYIFNYGYYILQLINYYIIFKITTKEEKKKIINFLLYAVIIICGLYFLSLISNTSLRTYEYSIYKEGWKGWSISAHYIGHCTLLLLPVIIYAIFEKKYINKWYKYLILLISIIPGFYLVGTKTPLFGIMAIMGFYWILYTFNILVKKKVLCLDYAILSVITIVLACTFSSTYGYKNFYNQMDVYNQDNTSAKTQLSLYIKNEEIEEIIDDNTINGDGKKLSPYLTTFEKRLKVSIKHFEKVDFSVFDNRSIQLKFNSYLRSVSPLRDKLLGYGYHTMINCLWVETDVFSIYYSFGLIGFLLIILVPLLCLILQSAGYLVNNKKLDSSKLFMGFSAFLAIGVITTVGYTIMFSQTVFYFILLLIITNDEFKAVDYKGKRKYLFMINDLNIGGAEVSMVDVVNELAKTDTVDVVLLRKNGELLKRLDSNINVYSILKDEYSKLKNKIYHIFYFLGRPFTKFVYMNTINTKYDVEVAFLEGYPAVFIASSLNKESTKIASIRVGLKSHKLSSDKIPWAAFLLRKAYKKMDKIYTVSKKATEEFIEKYPSCQSKTSTIYTYFDVLNIRNKSKGGPPRLFDKNKINFVALGRFNSQKGYDRLVDAFEEVHKLNDKVVLHIIGKNDTDIGKEIKAKIAEKKLSNCIKLYGVIDNPFPYVRQCDAFISSSYYEGYPRVINEALALQKVCIAPKVTGMDEALDNGKLGILVDNSTEGLINGMLDFLNTKNIKEKYEKAIQKYDGNKSRFFESFENLVKKKESMVIYFPKLSYGGMEKSLVNLINEIHLNDNYDLTLYLVYKGEQNYLNLLPKNINIVTASFESWNIFNKIIASINLGYRYIYSLVNKYDISISYSYQHPILTALAKKSSDNNIVYIHSNIKNGVDKSLLNKRIKRCRYQDFKKIICVSEDGKKALADLIGHEDKMHVINNIIDGETVIEKSNEAVDDFNFKKDGIYFINICRHEEEVKKVSRIIKATKKLNKEKFSFDVLLIGAGKDHEYYKNVIKKQKIDNVHVLGAKTNPYKYLAKSNALLLSSVREGYPVVYIESLILNKPIITTNVSDALKDIKGKYGIVVDNNDDSIYDGMKQFLLNGYEIKHKFNYKKFNKKIIKETENLYKS